MNEREIEQMYDAIMEVVEGKQYDSVMIVLGALHNQFALHHTSDEDKLRALYGMMADAAVCMAMLENEYSNELQTQENPPQKAQRKKARKKARDEPGPFGAH